VKHIKISGSTGGMYFYEEGDDVAEVTFTQVAEELANLIVRREEFTVTYE
jgi:hypothetical protein